MLPPELYGPAGALAVLGFVVVALIRGDLVPGFVHRKSELRADKYEAAFIDLLSRGKSVDNGGP